MRNVRFFLLLALHATRSAIASPAAAPLFDYEKIQLTDSYIAHLSDEHQGYLDFDDDAVRGSFTHQSGACKVQPTDNDFPPARIWQELNALQAVEGALVPTVPIGSPCYLNWGNFDPQKCATIAANWTNPYFHESDPTSNMFPIYQGRTCLPRLSLNTSCEIGSYPAWIMNVSSVAHIQLALNMARNANIRLVVKNTGHDYLGKSLGQGALSIWTHNLKEIEFIENYGSDSGYEGPAFKVAAGVTVRELYKAAEKNNVTVTGGICESVGFAGGYFAGGGHNPMSGYYGNQAPGMNMYSPRYYEGMAADNIEAVNLVTADGRFITASNTSYPDLFWALRGGGASTWGVTTSVLVRAHPKMQVVASTFIYSSGENVTADAFWNGTRKFWTMFPELAEAHTYSYFRIAKGQSNGTYTFSMNPFWAPGHTLESFNTLIAPWFDYLRELGINLTPKTRYHDSFYPAYNDNWGNETIGSATGLPGNRIFPRGNWEDPVKFERMFAAIKNTTVTGGRIVGYHQAPQNRLNVDNAVSSAFRHTLSFLIGLADVEGGENATQAQMQAAAHKLTYDVMQPWRDVAPESEFGGSYLNEANVVEPGWQRSFYGIQYERLLEIKRKWDPRGLFYATTGVGSEGWEVRDGEWGTQTQNGRLCRV